MSPFTTDTITILSAVGGVVGIVYATISVVKAREKHVTTTQCEKYHEEIELIQKEESEKREKEDSNLHEKVNKLSDRISKIEGSLSL